MLLDLISQGFINKAVYFPLIYSHAEYILRNNVLEEDGHEFKIEGRNTNNLYYTDSTTHNRKCRRSVDSSKKSHR